MTSTREPTYFLLQARIFDGETPLTTQMKPATGAQIGAGGLYPRYTAVAAEAMGRFSFADLGRPGSKGALISVRCWGTPDVGDRMEVRSLLEAEAIAGTDAINGFDQLLDTRQLATTWSRPVHVGPTDALAFVHEPEVGGAAIEVLRINLDGDSALDLMTAQLMLCCDPDSENNPQVFEVDETTNVPAWSGHMFILITGAAGTVATLPSIAAMQTGATAFIARVGGDVASYQPEGGDTVNGISLPTELAGFEGSMLHVIGEQWIATKAVRVNEVSVVNNTPNAIQLLPKITGDCTVVTIVQNEPGAYRMQAIADNPQYGGEIILNRRPSAPGVGKEQIAILPAVGENLNGVVNGIHYLGHNDNAVIRATNLTNNVVAGSLGEDEVLTTADANVTVKPWGRRRKIIRLTGAGQTVTLPLLADVPDGAELVVLNDGAASSNVARNAAPDVIAGLTVSSATSTAIAVAVARTFVASTAKWIVQ